VSSILANGVTTAQVLPGSGNIMGGEVSARAFKPSALSTGGRAGSQGGIFKLRGRRVEDMFVGGSPRLLKMVTHTLATGRRGH
jgi:hypothetical protein